VHPARDGVKRFRGPYLVVAGDELLGSELQRREWLGREVQ